VFVIDTNLLVFAANVRSADHGRAKELLDTWRTGERSWFLTWGIIYEFLRVSTHRAVFPEPLDWRRAQEWIEALLAGPRGGILVETERHAEVLREVVALHPSLSGNVIHDAHTAVLMKEHGIDEIRTADTDFHQFRFLRVVNPLE
jgi:hypothetical protein